ncbi:hypothetical protein L7F22_014120 [Adiantum nelumboides]|nr:hypothetical protein [Adiantum nelumboides]
MLYPGKRPYQRRALTRYLHPCCLILKADILPSLASSLFAARKPNAASSSYDAFNKWPFSFRRSDWPHPPSLVMWSIKDASEIFGVQEASLRTWAQEMVIGICREGRNNINSELWHACAGPLVSLPDIGSYCVYLPQGHSEQVAASLQQDVAAHVSNYHSNLLPQLVCHLHDIILHADRETDEVYCQMTLQPANVEKESCSLLDNSSQSKQPSVFFSKVLTASDTSTHGGFSIPRRAAERVFPPLDFSLQPPAQEIIAKDLHNTDWKFRHIFRGQPKRHLLTTGWSVFVSAKRLTAGDSILFVRNDKDNLFLGIRRAKWPQTNSSAVLSSDSMHIGVLAAAAHAAATNSRFTIFYNPSGTLHLLPSWL